MYDCNSHSLLLCIYSVDIMRKKLDPDDFGIILLNAFMSEFFADEVGASQVKFMLSFIIQIQYGNVSRFH